MYGKHTSTPNFQLFLLPHVLQSCFSTHSRACMRSSPTHTHTDVHTHVMCATTSLTIPVVLIRRTFSLASSRLHVYAGMCVRICALVRDTKRRPPVLRAYLRLNGAFHSAELKSRHVCIRVYECMYASMCMHTYVCMCSPRAMSPSHSSRISWSCYTRCTRPDYDHAVLRS